MSCKKGCIDPEATNYNEAAKRSDNSCEYLGRAYFYSHYPDKETIDTCGNVTVVVNSKSLGEVTSFWTIEDSIPYCSIFDDTSLMNRQGIVYIDLAPGTYEYRAKDQCNTWVETFTLESKSCNAIKVGY